MGDRPPRPREWTIHPDETGELDPQEIAQALAEAALVMHRIGGAVIAQAVRQQLDPEEWGDNAYVTSHLVIRWESYSPTSKVKPVEAEPEPVTA